MKGIGFDKEQGKLRKIRFCKSLSKLLFSFELYSVCINLNWFVLNELQGGGWMNTKSYTFYMGLLYLRNILCKKMCFCKRSIDFEVMMFGSVSPSYSGNIAGCRPYLLLHCALKSLLNRKIVDVKMSTMITNEWIFRASESSRRKGRFENKC